MKKIHLLLIAFLASSTLSYTYMAQEVLENIRLQLKNIMLQLQQVENMMEDKAPTMTEEPSFPDQNKVEETQPEDNDSLSGVIEHKEEEVSTPETTEMTESTSEMTETPAQEVPADLSQASDSVQDLPAPEQDKAETTIDEVEQASVEATPDMTEETTPETTQEGTLQATTESGPIMEEKVTQEETSDENTPEQPGETTEVTEEVTEQETPASESEEEMKEIEMTVNEDITDLPSGAPTLKQILAVGLISGEKEQDLKKLLQLKMGDFEEKFPSTEFLSFISDLNLLHAYANAISQYINLFNDVAQKGDKDDATRLQQRIDDTKQKYLDNVKKINDTYKTTEWYAFYVK